MARPIGRSPNRLQAVVRCSYKGRMARRGFRCPRADQRGAGMRNNGDDYENRPRKHGLTQAEEAQRRKAASDANLVRALAARRALKAREG